MNTAYAIALLKTIRDSTESLELTADQRRALVYAIHWMESESVVNKVSLDGSTNKPVPSQAEEEIAANAVVRGKLPRLVGKHRPSGLAAGQFVVPDDFDTPLADDILNGFEG